MFSFSNRKHHCRKCGDVVCDPCSPRSVMLAGSIVQQRVCQFCYTQVSALTKFIEDDLHEVTHNLEIAAGAIKFEIYEGYSGAPYVSPVWLSGSMMLVCYYSPEGKLQGIPVTQFEEVKSRLLSIKSH